MAKETFYENYGSETALAPYRGPEQTIERIIRRAVLETIDFMGIWAERKDPITRNMIRTTAKHPSLYQEGKGWREVLEDFCGFNIEIIGLKTPFCWLTACAGKLCPTTQRFLDLGKAAQDTLLLSWHKQSGLIAVCPEPELKFIYPTTCLQTTLTKQENQTTLWLWNWDRKLLRAKNDLSQ